MLGGAVGASIERAIERNRSAHDGVLDLREQAREQLARPLAEHDLKREGSLQAQMADVAAIGILEPADGFLRDAEQVSELGLCERMLAPQKNNFGGHVEKN